MKNLSLLGLFALPIFCLTWCEIDHNFMDVDNPNAKEDLQHYVSDWKIPQINADDLVPNSLSWTWKDVKWYANKYYEDTFEEYVGVAKEGLSWAKESLKWYYNDWVDEINRMVNEKVSGVISWELNKFKIQ